MKGKEECVDVELMEVSSKWRGGERERLDQIIVRAEETLKAIRIDQKSSDWANLRELAASLGHTAAQLQAQAAVMTIIEPTENAKKARGQ